MFINYEEIPLGHYYVQAGEFEYRTISLTDVCMKEDFGFCWRNDMPYDANIGECYNTPYWLVFRRPSGFWVSCLFKERLNEIDLITSVAPYDRWETQAEGLAAACAKQDSDTILYFLDSLHKIQKGLSLPPIRPRRSCR